MAQTTESSALRWTVIGTIIAVIGIGVPIVWDLYKTRNALQLELVNKSAVFSQSEKIDGLKILFRDLPVENLTRLDFILTNTGSTPIRESEVVEKPTLHFEEQSTILDAEIKKRTPSNLAVQIATDSKKRKLEITFPLLNPSESITFSLLVDGKAPRFVALARIANLRELSFKDQTREATESKVKIRWPTYLVGFVGSIFLLLFFGSLSQLSKVRRASIKLANETSDTPEFLTTSEAAALLNRLDPYLESEANKRLLQAAARSTDEQGRIVGKALNAALLREFATTQKLKNATRIGIAINVSAILLAGWYVTRTLIPVFWG